MAEQRIEPALNAEQWQSVKADHATALTMTLIAGGNFPEWGKLVAIANDALADDDPRKFTREWVDVLRTAAVSLDPNFYAGERVEQRVQAFADALASYLPPEAP